MTSITRRQDKDIPVLLAAICSHKDCPDWLREGIWDTVNEQANRADRPIRFDEQWWRNEWTTIFVEEVVS